MFDGRLSRRRALHAGIAAVPVVFLGGGATSAIASINANSSDAKQPGSASTLNEVGGNQEESKKQSESLQKKEKGMELGAFSVSLTVKDLKTSREFYEKFGFKPFAGNPEQNWQILKNGDHVIGLFQGMFEKNILTFNPGWNQNAEKLSTFTDVRELQRQLKAQGVKPVSEADEKTKGPASFMAIDPDGNPILLDQHV